MHIGWFGADKVADGSFVLIEFRESAARKSTSKA
jgi:hypothetical protein